MAEPMTAQSTSAASAEETAADLKLAKRHARNLFAISPDRQRRVQQWTAEELAELAKPKGGAE